MLPFPSALLNHVLPAAQHASWAPTPGQGLLHAAHRGCLAPREGEGTVRNGAHDFGEQPFPLASPQGHGGGEGDGDAAFQVRRNLTALAVRRSR